MIALARAVMPKEKRKANDGRAACMGCGKKTYYAFCDMCAPPPFNHKDQLGPTDDEPESDRRRCGIPCNASGRPITYLGPLGEKDD